MTYKPFASVLIVIATLLIYTIGKMEQRRMGYLTLKLNKSLRSIQDVKRELDLQLAMATQPGRVESLAFTRNRLNRSSNKVIAISGGRVAVRQK